MRLPHSSPADRTGGEPLQIESAEESSKVPQNLRTTQYRIYPTRKQEQTLLKWMGTARWTYNKIIQHKNDDASLKCTKGNLRALSVNAIAPDVVDNPWVMDTPFEIRDQAMIDYIKARAAGWSKSQKRKDRGQDKETMSEYKFRSRKDRTQTISVLKKNWGRARGVYSDVFHADKMKSEKPLPQKLEFDTRLTRTRLGEYYLAVQTRVQPIRRENQSPERVKTISLDPGVRTFMTGYDKDGFVQEWGTAASRQRIVRLCIKYDKVRSLMDHPDTRSRLRCRLRKVALRMQRKLSNLVRDLHRKLAKWLCENYDVVLIPTFEVKNMVAKKSDMSKRLHSKTARAMCCWSHFAFRRSLIAKSKQYEGMQVLQVTEEYTSKTCGVCGKLNASLAGGKVFKCPTCGYCTDRDANGARNILLKHCETVV